MHYKEVKGILSANNGMNLYRGCTHGCIYCDSRSTCYHMEHPFEDIEVKSNALELLEETLKRKRKRCMIGTGSMTDPYIPLEKEIGMVRRALELICRYGFGFTVITKSDLILRDLDLLKEINRNTKCVVQMTMTTSDEKLCSVLEPNVCTTARRFEVLNKLRDEGIPTVVWLCPILPFINDTVENVSAVTDMCIEAGVYGIVNFGMGVTLREGSREYFYRQLDRHFPGLKEKYIHTYGKRYELDSPDAAVLTELFRNKCRENDIICDNEAVFGYLDRFEDSSEGQQLTLF